jgi:hypothetical protein
LLEGPEGPDSNSRWTIPTGKTAEDGYEGMAPLGSFPAKGYRLFDIAGNA